MDIHYSRVIYNESFLCLRIFTFRNQLAVYYRNFIQLIVSLYYILWCTIALKREKDHRLLNSRI